MTNELISALLEISSFSNLYSFCITFYLYFLLHIAELYVYVISEIYLVILSIYVYGTGLSTIKSPKVFVFRAFFFQLLGDFFQPPLILILVQSNFLLSCSSISTVMLLRSYCGFQFHSLRAQESSKRSGQLSAIPCFNGSTS